LSGDPCGEVQMTSTISTYKSVTDHFEKSIERIGVDAQVQRESKYYKDNIGSIKTIADFVSNDRIYRFAMTAFGLKEMIYAKAFVKKVLTDGIDSPQSFTNQLTDPRFKELATTFNFKNLGSTTTIFDRAQKGVIDKFLQIKLEENAGAANEGVRLALYFRRQAPNIKSAYSILGDAALYKVAQVALGLTPSSSATSLDNQVSVIKSHLDLTKLNDPGTLETFLTKFMTKWDISNNASGTLVPAVVLSRGLQSITSVETLTKIQSLSLGGRR
jgi:Protein of unknown function (DUF1217)